MDLVRGKFWLSQSLWTLILFVSMLALMRVQPVGVPYAFVAAGIAIPLLYVVLPPRFHLAVHGWTIGVAAVIIFSSSWYALGKGLEPPSYNWVVSGFGLFVSFLMAEQALRITDTEDSGALLFHKLFFYLTAPAGAVLALLAYWAADAAAWFCIGVASLAVIGQFCHSLFLDVEYARRVESTTVSHIKAA